MTGASRARPGDRQEGGANEQGEGRYCVDKLHASAGAGAGRDWTGKGGVGLVDRMFHTTCTNRSGGGRVGVWGGVVVDGWCVSLRCRLCSGILIAMGMIAMGIIL